MCETCDVIELRAGTVGADRPAVSRRRAAAALVGATAGGLALAGSSRGAAASRSRGATPLGAPRPEIRPRSSWGSDRPPAGPLEVERPEDVRMLLVHHTAGSNDYGPAAVPDTLRAIHRMHTDPAKGWPDVAYNFLVDRHGGIWEGRAGSIDAPVKGSATGGSQGFALLCCFIGMHTEVPPTEAAQGSMVALLAWLADRYGIDTAPGATTTFVSRGSNLHPQGSTVTAATICGHRDMSATACPGDAAYALVTDHLPRRVTELRSSHAAPSSPVEPAAPTAPTAPTAPAAPASSSTSTSTVAVPTTAPRELPPAEPGQVAQAPAAEPAPDSDAAIPLVAVGLGAAALTGAAVAALRRRRRPPDRPEPDARAESQQSGT